MTRRAYAIHCVGILLLKSIVEVGIVWWHNGAVPPMRELTLHLLATLHTLVSPEVDWIHLPSLMCNVPFAWIMFSMSVRRAANTGLTPWSGSAVLLPTVNIGAIVALLLLRERHDEPRESHRDERLLFCDTIPHYRRALVAIGAAAGIGVVMTVVNSHLFTDVGAMPFFTIPLLMGVCAGYVYNRRHSKSWDGTLVVATLVTLFSFLVVLPSIDGLLVLCLLVISLIEYPICLIGSAIGKSLADWTTCRLLPTADL